MPSHRHCLVPGCSNRRDSCKYGLFVGDDGKYFRARLCGSTSTSNSRVRQGCRGESDLCKAVTFHRLPKDKELRKRWLAAIPRVNTPTTANSYVCGQHFVRGHRRSVHDVPTVFESRRAVRPRQTFASMGRTERAGDDGVPKSSQESSTAGKDVPEDESLPPFAPEVAANVAEALDELSLREQLRVLKERLDASQKEATQCKEALEEARAQLKKFGYAYACEDETVFKFLRAFELRTYGHSS